MKAELVAGVDLGHVKVSAVIAQIEPDQGMRVIGVGQQLSRGLRQGVIVDMDALETSILNAVNQAEEMAQETVSHVVLGISGGFFSQLGDVDIPIHGREILESDLSTLLSSTKQLLAQNGWRGGISNTQTTTPQSEIIHAFPLSYCVDGARGIRDPRGMMAERLGMNLHVVGHPSVNHRHLIHCLGRCHLSLSDLVVAPYASALSTLVEDEMDLGVTLVDMGGGSTTFATFAEGNCVRVGRLNVGGMHVTHDIAHGLSTPVIQAERLKTLYGSVLTTYSDERETLTVPQMGEDQQAQAMQVTRATLNRIIRPRVEEILELLRDQLDMISPVQGATRRVVLTGGASQLNGLRDLASHLLNRSVRLARPLHIRGLTDAASCPGFSSVLGLLHYGQARQQGAGRRGRGASVLRTRLSALFRRRYRVS